MQWLVSCQSHLVHISAKSLHLWEVIKDLQICKQIREREPSSCLESWGFLYENHVYIPVVLTNVADLEGSFSHQQGRQFLQERCIQQMAKIHYF